jgi:hypothetical protein
MHRNNSARSEAQAASPSPGRFADETPAQQAKHREVEFEYRRRRGKRRSPKTFVRICDLERVFADRYNGALLPDDDSGLGDIFIMANHLAHLDAPDRRIIAWVSRWAPWHGDDKIAALLEMVLRKPLKWTADKLAHHLRLTYATRMRLGITTIGSIDCKRLSVRSFARNGTMQRNKRAEQMPVPSRIPRRQSKLSHGKRSGSAARHTTAVLPPA